MKQTFTDYLRSLAATGGEPTASAFDELWTELRRSLARELRRRGLWDSPPSHLGVLGFPAWTTPESRRARGAPSRTRDGLDELTTDAYVELFITRGETLRRYVRAGRSIEGVVTTGLRQLLHDRQKRHDRLGFRVFQALRASIEQAVEEGRLHLLGGKTTIHNDTVLSFRADAEASVVGLDAAEGDPLTPEAPPVGEIWPGDEILAREVERWNAELLTAWITARGDEMVALVARLEPRLLELAEAGVEAFRFKTLVDAVKQDLRVRLAALWAGRDPLRAREAEGGAPAAGAAGDDPLARMVERDRLRELGVLPASVRD